MDRRAVLSGGLAVCASPFPARADICEQAGGRFVGKIRLERDKDGYFTLLESYGFVDGCGKTWLAPEGATTDGASIPRVAQLFVGDPYSGPYLNAAIVHDWFCVARVETYFDVHRMFYNGMIANGVGPSLARIMYAAVCWRGPKWDAVTIKNARRMMASGQTIKPPRPPAGLPPGPPLPPPTAVPAPDPKLLQLSRRAMTAQDIASAQAYMSAYEDQSVAFHRYMADNQKYLEDNLEASATTSRYAQEDQAALEARNARFRRLLAITEAGDKSLDDVAAIADRFEDGTELLPTDPAERADGRAIPIDPDAAFSANKRATPR